LAEQEGAIKFRPVRSFAAVTFIIAIILTAVIRWYLALDIVLSWLIAFTLVAFVTYGYDKAIAGSDRTRVPEKVLLALTLAGGTMGTFLARALFRHKTMKASFRTQLWLVVLAQVIVVIGYFVWVGSRL
jgi:uncharacterized membrane protein YsdA (DUF1294 family)